MKDFVRRACKVTLKFATSRKRKAIAALLEAYRGAVNFYIRSLWHERGGLDKATLARLNRTRLSARYKSAALKQALDIICGTRKASAATGNRCSRPIFNGAAFLDAKLVSVSAGCKSFDLSIRLSTLRKGHPITVLTKHTAMTRKWLKRPLAKFVQGCALSENGIVLWVVIPDLPSKETGSVLAVDQGMTHTLADSDGRFYGDQFKQVSDKIRRRKRGSRSMRRALTERDHYFNRTLKALPWDTMRVLGLEDLKNLKRGKRRNRGKQFRKAMAPWVYRRVLTRATHIAQENRVLLVKYPPAHTSLTCPVCGEVSKHNRKGEVFACVSCGHTEHADTVGARNGLARTLAILGSIKSPGPTKSQC